MIASRLCALGILSLLAVQGHADSLRAPRPTPTAIVALQGNLSRAAPSYDLKRPAQAGNLTLRFIVRQAPGKTIAMVLGFQKVDKSAWAFSVVPVRRDAELIRNGTGFVVFSARGKLLRPLDPITLSVLGGRDKVAVRLDFAGLTGGVGRSYVAAKVAMLA